MLTLPMVFNFICHNEVAKQVIVSKKKLWRFMLKSDVVLCFFLICYCKKLGANISILVEMVRAPNLHNHNEPRFKRHILRINGTRIFLDILIVFKIFFISHKKILATFEL